MPIRDIFVLLIEVSNFGYNKSVFSYAADQKI
jgi:hypothetical protein